MAVRGEFRWPSAGRLSGRLWGVLRGRRQVSPGYERGTLWRGQPGLRQAAPRSAGLRCHDSLDALGYDSFNVDLHGENDRNCSF